MPDFTGELIIKYLDNSITETEEKQLLEWLQASEENREMFLTCKKIYSLGKIRHYSNRIQLESALEKVTKQTENIRKNKSRQIYIRISKYAAILVFILVIPSLLWFVFRTKPQQYQTIEISENEPVKSIVLPDGSKVWINNNSSFAYPESFSQNKREVSLEGEAFFQVKTDSLHPFIVKTNGMQVRVYGTTFNINTRGQRNLIETTLVSGKVGIGDTEGNTLATLSPGQLASFDQVKRKVRLTEVNTDLYTSWHKGLFIFDKASLTDITRKIEEVYNVRVTVNTTKPLNNKANFVFRKNQPVDTVLEMLKFVLPVDYKKYNDQIYINLK